MNSFSVETGKEIECGLKRMAFLCLNFKALFFVKKYQSRNSKKFNIEFIFKAEKLITNYGIFYVFLIQAKISSNVI